MQPLSDYVTKVGCCRWMAVISLCVQRISRKSKHFHILEPFMRFGLGLLMSSRAILVGGGNP
jgi:hypothetical protein